MIKGLENILYTKVDQELNLLSISKRRFKGWLDHSSEKPHEEQQFLHRRIFDLAGKDIRGSIAASQSQTNFKQK